MAGASAHKNEEAAGTVGFAPERRAPIADESQWRVVSGPGDRGEVLAKRESESSIRYVAPPGVPLRIPEPVAMLRRWRTASWEYGFVVGDVETMDLEQVLELADANTPWVQAQMRELRRRSLIVQGVPADEIESLTASQDEPSDARVVLTLPNQRPLGDITQSASTFSAIVGELPEDAAVVHLATLTDSAPNREVFDAGVRSIVDSVGSVPTQELALVLLHARARSHSWRCTRALAVLERHSPTQRLIEAEIDGAKTVEELRNELASVELPAGELREQLLEILYSRSNGPRWKLTAFARRWLASRRLRSVRDLLRTRVHPLVDRIRGERSSPRLSSPGS